MDFSVSTPSDCSVLLGPFGATQRYSRAVRRIVSFICPYPSGAKRIAITTSVDPRLQVFELIEMTSETTSGGARKERWEFKNAFCGHKSSVRSIAVLDGGYVASGDMKGMLLVWSPSSLKAHSIVNTGDDPIWTIRTLRTSDADRSKGVSRFIIGTAGGKLQRWEFCDRIHGHTLKVLETHINHGTGHHRDSPPGIHEVAAFKNRIIVGQSDNRAMVRFSNAFEDRPIVLELNASVAGVAIDGRYFVTSTGKLGSNGRLDGRGTVDIWNAKNAEHLFSLPLGSPFKGGITNKLPNMLLAEDYIVIAPRRGSTLDLINLSTRKIVASLSFKFTVIDFAFDCKSPGRFYVCGNSNLGKESVGNACVISWEALQLVMGGRQFPEASLVNQENRDAPVEAVYSPTVAPQNAFALTSTVPSSAPAHGWSDQPPVRAAQGPSNSQFLGTSFSLTTTPPLKRSPQSYLDFLQNRGVNANVVENMCSEDIAELLAAYLILFDFGGDQRNETLFWDLRQCLSLALRTSGIINGSLLTGVHPAYSSEGFVEELLKGMKKAEGENLIFPYTKKLLYKFKAACRCASEKSLVMATAKPVEIKKSRGGPSVAHPMEETLEARPEKMARVEGKENEDEVIEVVKKLSGDIVFIE